MKSYTDVSVTKARAIAKQSTQYGYFHPIDTIYSWAYCPDCKAKVDGIHNAWAKRGEQVKAVHAAMVDHLIDGSCPKHPEIKEF